MNVLEILNISKSFPDGNSSREILKNLNFTLKEGEMVAITGPSGSGKTTLLNIIGTLDKQDSGEIFFKNNPIESYTANELARFRNQHLGFVFQDHHLLPQCTLIENMLVPTIPLNTKSADILPWAEELLKNTGLWEFRNRYPATLSGGERQRAAVIRALINKPLLLLADEPTGALDQSNADQLGNLLTEINQRYNISVILVSHSMELANKTGNIYHLTNGILEKQ